MAERRREAFRQLIVDDPRAAFDLAIDQARLTRLPPAVRERMEQPVAGRAFYGVLCVQEADGSERCGRLERHVVIDGRRYEAHVPEALADIPTQGEVFLRGVAVDNRLALHAISVGNKPTWTTGLKSVLVIRVDFEDLPGEPVTLEDVDEMLNRHARVFFEENSKGQVSLVASTTPVCRMPQSAEHYKAKRDYLKLLADARTAAQENGFDYLGYDLEIVSFQPIFEGWSGLGYVGQRAVWINGDFAQRVIIHELGHNLGLWHANSWEAQKDTVIGPGTLKEYGDQYDSMGRRGGERHHFGAWQKSLLGWLDPTEWTTATESGRYRVFAHDSAIGSGLCQFLRIPNPRGSRYDYCVEFRQQFTGNSWLMNGVRLCWILDHAGGWSSRVLDTTPGSPWGDEDHPIVMGRTFSDVAAGIHITPIAKAGTLPEAMDVMIYRGDFPSNQTPSISLYASNQNLERNELVEFTAVAEDPDGDDLAYFWELGDATLGPNSATTSHRWNAVGNYAVRCTVSDMKGGKASQSVRITVGKPISPVIEGRVLDENGFPVAGVRIHNSVETAKWEYRATYTDSHGDYTLSNLNPGGQSIRAVHPHYEFEAEDTANPVVLTSGFARIDFRASRTTLNLSGQVVEGGQGLPEVLVSNGHDWVMTDAAGRYEFSGQLPGMFTLSATKLGYHFINRGFQNPVLLDFSDQSRTDFVGSWTDARPVILLSSTDSGLTEGSRTPAELTVLRRGSVAGETIVSLTYSGTATPNQDFHPASGQVKLGPGQERLSIPFHALYDATIEGEETIVVEIQTAEAYVVGEVSRIEWTLHDSEVDRWRAERFISVGVSTELSGDFSDADADGWSNMAEYAFGSDPLSADREGMPLVRNGPNGPELVLRKRKHLDPVRVDVEQSPTVSGPWYPVPDLERVQDEGAFEWLRVSPPATVADRRFYRIGVRGYR